MSAMPSLRGQPRALDLASVQGSLAPFPPCLFITIVRNPQALSV